MELPRIDHHSGAGISGGLADLDPRLIEKLRSAVAALSRGQGPGGPPPEGAAPDGAKQEEKKPARDWGQFVQIACALVLTGASALGVLVYMQLTAELNQTRADLARVRLEMGLVRNQLVRKEEFSSRNLAAFALTRDAELKTKTASDASLRRLEDHRQSVEKQLERLEKLRAKKAGLEKRIAALEKRQSEAPPPTSPGKGKSASKKKR
jgi:hypothetical protein